jgi:hypothetical protein
MVNALECTCWMRTKCGVLGKAVFSGKTTLGKWWIAPGYLCVLLLLYVRIMYEHGSVHLSCQRPPISQAGAEMASTYRKEQTVDYTVLYAIHGTIYGFALTV